MSAVRTCVRCVLGTDDHAEIEFDASGLCNHCRAFDRQVAALPHTQEERSRRYREIIDAIKVAGRGKTYDCILGLSGGVDSSYLALLCRREGLRPLVVHFDNGWNSELAVRNIESIVSRLGFDLSTYVINWEEFRQLQLAYLRASVVDIEALTDHAIYGSLMRLALEHDIHFVLSGNNVATEGVLPYSWTHRKSDYVNILDIHRKFGEGSIRTFPFLDRRIKRRVRRAGIQIVTLLDYVPYEKKAVKQLLSDELGWRDYGGKHYESVFTRFYQSYILPNKFGIDKRKAHLSSLICSGQISKEEALRELQNSIDDPERIEADRRYVIKKLGLSESEFDSIMKLPVRKHTDFEVEGGFFSHYPVFKPLKRLWIAIRPAVAATGLKRFAQV
jgi:N-acetyl sugar amidotransferase